MSFKPLILRFETLASTNTEALNQARRGAPEGLTILALEQSGGRGRRERQWISPAGAGLYASILLRPCMDLKSWPLLQLMAGVAVSKSIQELCGLTTDIKWPNDLLAGEKKLCGILAETTETPLGRACILGIGINLRKAKLPAEMEAAATSIEAETNKPIDREDLLASILQNVNTQYDLLQASRGAAQTIKTWCQQSSYASGAWVSVSLDTNHIEGRTAGLGPEGQLRLETATGERIEVLAGDVVKLRLSKPEVSGVKGNG